MKKSRMHPPKIAEKIIHILIDETTGYTALGDYEEAFHEIRKKHSYIYAALRYWLIIPCLIPAFFFDSFLWSLIMLNNCLKITLRNLNRHKTYSSINIAGLTVGIACFILILFYVQYEFNYEKHNPNVESVYYVNVEHRRGDDVYRVGASPFPLAAALSQEIPDIETFTRVNFMSRRIVAYEDNQFYETNMALTDPGVFDIFGIDVLQGEKNKALNEPFTAAITEQIANKYFGDSDPIGKTLLLDNENAVMVKSVIKDHPLNTNFNPDIIISFETIRAMFGNRPFENWLSNSIDSYVMGVEGHSPIELDKKINQVFRNNILEDDDRVLVLERLDKIHLYSDTMGNGDIRHVQIFLTIGFLIILTACINFMNLSTARSSKRSKEVGLRKVVGANRRQLILQFMGESYIYTIFSMVLALLISASLLPLLKNLTGQSLEFGQLFQTWIILTLLGILLLVGFLAGSYPAIFLSAFQPGKVIKAMHQTGRRGTLFRLILVVTQFTISIILIVATFVLGKQVHYMRTRSLGFKQDQIIVLRNRVGGGDGDIEPIRQALLRNPRIESVCGSWMLPSRIGAYNEVTWEGASSDKEVIPIIQNGVTYDFFQTYEIDVIQGREFSREFPSDIQRGSRDSENAGSVIINETAVQRFGWTEPIGKKIIQVFGELRIVYTVIGVVKDFHFATLDQPIMPLKIFLTPQNTGYISIKVQSEDVSQTLQEVESAWNQFKPNVPMSHFFFNSLFAQRYENEERLRTLTGYFSLLVVFISCLGLLGLASFASEQRTKEVGVRKVLGATSTGLVLLLSNEFSRLILLANLIALPSAYYIVYQWLQGFAYRITLQNHWHVFLFAGAMALGIAWVTVAIQATKAAIRNPVESLRYE